MNLINNTFIKIFIILYTGIYQSDTGPLADKNSHSDHMKILMDIP